MATPTADGTGPRRVVQPPHPLSKRKVAAAKRTVAAPDIEARNLTLKQAVRAVKEEGMSLAAAVFKFGEPKSTLHDRLKTPTGEAAPVGRPLRLSGELEAALVAMFATFARADLPLLASNISAVARQVALSHGIADFKASPEWF